MEIKQLLLKNWTLWRVTRLLLSFVFIINGIIKADYVLVTGGVFLFGHAILNVCSTCAGGNCEIPEKK